MPSDVQPAVELPGPLPTGPPRAVPLRVNTSTEKEEFAAPLLPVRKPVMKIGAESASRSKKIAQPAPPPLSVGPGLALSTSARTAEASRMLIKIPTQRFLAGLMELLPHQKLGCRIG